MPRRLIITIVCFHISAVLSALSGITLLVAASMFTELFRQAGPRSDYVLSQVATAMGVALPVFAGIAVVAAVGIELTINGLNKRKYWAWIVGLVLSGLMIMSGMQNIIGFALGGLALWGLVDPDTVAAFRPDAGEPPVADS